jgi:hypothetical protein
LHEERSLSVSTHTQRKQQTAYRRKIMVASDTIITESTKVYPRGRGKTLIISEKSIQKRKDKFKKKNPSFLHEIIQSNPESIKLIEYEDGDRKRIVLYPEKRILDYQERLNLGCALLVTIPYYRTVVRCGKHHKTCNTFRITEEIRNNLNRKLRRYEAWRKRNM